MTSSLRLELTDDARADFRSILRYTRRRWGVEQRRIYGRHLEAAMEQLTRFPRQGEERDDLPHGMRARVVAEHVIYYRADDERVAVIRPLHASMDAERHLKG